ncbi:hypothetical protein CJ671_11090, partial [Aliarcobacter cryaerophilus]
LLVGGRRAGHRDSRRVGVVRGGVAVVTAVGRVGGSGPGVEGAGVVGVTWAPAGGPDGVG